MTMLSKNIIESIRNQFGTPTPESVTAASSGRKGVMSRTAKKMEEALDSTAEQALSSVADLMSKTREARTPPEDQETPNLDYYEGVGIDASMDSTIAQDKMGEGLEGVGVDYTPERGTQVYKSAEEMSELEILAKTIEAETRGEGYEGKIAVGAVIANRAASGKYGKGISGVILKKGQFSPWNDYTGYAKGEQGQDMLKIKPSASSYKAAEAILKGDYEDVTKGATHYYNPAVSTPDWEDDMQSRKRGTIKLGNHLFGNADSEQTYDGKSWVTSRARD